MLGKKGRPVRIGKLESFIAQFDSDMQLTHERIPEKKTRGKVAIIGSGPAGLTVAGDLARQGFHVTIFEGQPEAGGVLMCGIPEYLPPPKAVVRNEIKKIEDLGVHFRARNCLVGTPESGVTADSLFRQEGFDAIFMGTGTALPQNLSIPGSDLRRVTQSTDFLHNVNAYVEGALPMEMVPLRKGDKCGGDWRRQRGDGRGHAPRDVSRADVTVIYRRTQAEMPAIQSEYEDAVKGRGQLHVADHFLEFLGNKSGTYLCHLASSTPDHGECTEPFDRVFLAIGLAPCQPHRQLNPGHLRVDERKDMSSWANARWA